MAAQRGGDNVNERLLFHCTSFDNSQGIMRARRD